MKHLQPYIEYIRESVQEEPNQIDSREYISIIGKRQLQSTHQFNDEDKAKLEVLHKSLSDTASANQRITTTHPAGLEATISMGVEGAYPILFLGKQSDTSFTLRTQARNDDHSEQKYYHFPSIEEMIHFIASNYGPKIKWTEIK